MPGKQPGAGVQQSDMKLRGSESADLCPPVGGPLAALPPLFSLLREWERAGYLYLRAAASALCARAPCYGLVGGLEGVGGGPGGGS